MDRNNGRFTYIRRQGQSSSSSNNNQHLDNHRNSTSSQYSNSSNSSSYGSSQNMMASREPLTQHDELIRYIREAWTKVTETGASHVYRGSESDHQLKNFKPFNLEEYWGQRLVQNIQVSHGHQ